MNTIQESPIRHELEQRYLAYALSTIISRSLPDVRDGLKPVHRRILFAMRALHLDPTTPPKKSARVVGDVIGKFHPHGDQAAYDAMVRLAQEFAVRYPLVDGQGNFGNIDGDGAAAMRYTEARLTRIAMAMLEDLERDTVDMTPTYDGSQQEPVVLPARFPNLLANGATGIAVGMSTSIPPHNVGEILDACLWLIDHPHATIPELMVHLPAPDFPTGGVLTSEPEERLAIYEGGRGSLRLRCRWHKEQQTHGTWRIVVTEIPYQVPKSRLIESIAQLIVDRKCLFLSDVRDESDEKIRIVLEPRSRTLDAELIMAYLFKNTDLENRITVNLNVITASVRPQVLNLKEILQAWLDHRFQVHTRRARFELAAIGRRLHLLKALLIAHLNIDEVIAIIKEHDEPAPVLMSRFLLDREQADAILDMRLRSLRKLEEMVIRKEMLEKEERAAALTRMLEDQAIMWGEIRKEVVTTRQEFADHRRTEIVGAPVEVSLKPEDLVQKEPITLILSRMGWVKTIKGHEAEAVAKLRFKGEDGLFVSLPVHTTDTITFLSTNGKVYSTLADRISSGKGFGDPITMMFDLDHGESINYVLTTQPHQEYFVTTRLGQGFRILGSDLQTSYRSGRQTISYKTGDQLLHILPVKGPMLAAIGRSRRLLVCRLDEFPLLSKGQGVRIQRLIRGEVMVDVITFTESEGVTLSSGSRTRLLTDLSPWASQRATRGAMLPHGFLSGAVFVGTGASLLPAGKGYMDELLLESDA
ncbi:MAG: DNA topoisomerase IV subunit A [Magnetococcales bacterium]|nr:DNA topoisomerase IV subunit A [Magnetococcales bacterium]NGZ28254.1 DNA topoisomerase IV subunit A [Magnetococcales bacterium]